MNQNMEDTRKWYAEHGMLDVFMKKYICSKCRYEDTCHGLTDKEARISCKEFKYKKNRGPAKWDVSYNRVPAYGSLTMAQRIHREG